MSEITFEKESDRDKVYILLKDTFPDGYIDPAMSGYSWYILKDFYFEITELPRGFIKPVKKYKYTLKHLSSGAFGLVSIPAGYITVIEAFDKVKHYFNPKND